VDGGVPGGRSSTECHQLLTVVRQVLLEISFNQTEFLYFVVVLSYGLVCAIASRHIVLYHLFVVSKVYFTYILYIYIYIYTIFRDIMSPWHSSETIK